MNHTGPNPPNNSKIKVVAIVPARYDSARLPGKALLEIAGKPMICRVAARALAAGNVDRVIVATDDQRILDAVKSAGFEALLTSSHHRSGTDRVAEVAESLPDYQIIVNVQGDEPLISPNTIEQAVARMLRALEDDDDGERTERDRIGIVTSWEQIESAPDAGNPDVVKIVVDENEHAVYFSRSAVPYPRDAVLRHGSLEQALNKEAELLSGFKKHTGLYVYRRDILLAFSKWPQTELERTESLEQLRALDHNVKIVAIKASVPSIGVDTWEDLERVRKIVSSLEFPV